MKRVLLILFIVLFLSSCGLKQSCPDEWIFNEMPCVYEQSPLECETPARQYLIVDGIRAEITEYDMEWVVNHCDLQPTIVS